MHIQQLQIDGNSRHREIAIHHFSPGLNLLYGAPTSGKTSVTAFLQSLIARHSGSMDTSHASGSVVIGSASGRYRVTRDWRGERN